MKNSINNRYSDSLINEVVSQVKSKRRLLSEVAKEYGIASRTVYQWVKVTEEPTQQKKVQIADQIAALQLQIQDLNKQLQMIA
ncbi:transposase [Shewanella gaetbuli]|uniref:Transposase n=1 Tax=Shewanella gaetbuli TaxID=220752 RepID=A0A9X1ZK53_9GAMM|nr:transposase [Shewanella gaetbuli]MCL1143754.1 transposase [Shewanella gaetbuli]